ncbi:MAG TPA: histidine kinase, partial [Pilimelia sp.]|nr:histidine kinase [Pilimelia sp.]
WLLLAVGVLAGLTLVLSIPADGPAAWLRAVLWWPGYGLLLLVLLLFPGGRPGSRGWAGLAAWLSMTVVAGTVALASLELRAPGLISGDARVAAGWDRAVFLGASLALVAGGALTIVAAGVRVLRAPAAGRGPLLWAAVNILLLVVVMVLDAVADVSTAWLAGALAIPAVTTVGVLRYGLYDIGLLVHRSLLYGPLTVLVIVVYAGVVALAARLAPAAAAPAAAAVTVIAVLPLRQAVQALLERSLYGQRARPYELVSRISRRISQAGTPEQILAEAVTAIGDGLRAPYAAVRLGSRTASPGWPTGDPAGGPTAAHGRRRPWPVATLTLTHRGAPIGQLFVQQRGPDEPWSRRESALLRDLAGQLGPVAAAVRLTHELRAARERLVGAREEEARRLQRDLHDGIGPTLSGARMLVRAGRAQAGGGAVVQTLDRLEEGLADAAVEVRRILDNLRPPALDRGLAAALDTAARRHRSPLLDVALTVRGDLADLPAAVEVATYRVVDEALANVVRHARAASALVTVVREPDRLTVAVRDDGIGGAAARAGGVGLESMAQRCAELGGTLRLVGHTPGTGVVAVIPLG